MIFVKPFYNSFWDNLLCFSLLRKNNREKGRERLKTQYEYEKVVQKLSQNGCTNITQRNSKSYSNRINNGIWNFHKVKLASVIHIDG
jgi:hypothetical protein